MKKYHWKLIPGQTFVTLKAKYLVYGNIVAAFSEFDAAILADGSFSEPEITFHIRTASISTGDPDQDEKFRSDAYLSAKAFPKIIWHSVNGCHPSLGGIQEVYGDLSIKGAWHPITFVVSFMEIRTIPQGKKARFHLFANVRLAQWEVGHDDFDIGNDVLIVVEVELLRGKEEQ